MHVLSEEDICLTSDAARSVWCYTIVFSWACCDLDAFEGN